MAYRESREKYLRLAAFSGICESSTAISAIPPIVPADAALRDGSRADVEGQVEFSVIWKLGTVAAAARILPRN